MFVYTNKFFDMSSRIECVDKEIVLKRDLANGGLACGVQSPGSGHQKVWVLLLRLLFASFMPA